MNRPLLLTLSAVMLSSLLAGFAAAGDRSLVYFGCYTTQKSGSKGILVAEFNSATGALTQPVLAAGSMDSPSFLALSPDGKFLYSAGESGTPDHKSGDISAFRISLPDGKLSKLNEVSSVGSGPCHVSLDLTGRMVMTANYGGGSVASYGVGPDGKLSPAVTFVQHSGSGANPGRQEGPHAHSMNVTPDNRFALCCDLGLDKVIIYKIDPATGKMTAHGETGLAPGTGPRHLAFHPNGKFAFVNGEMAMNAVTLAYDAEKGTLTETGSASTLPPEDRDKKGLSTAETAVHPNGRFVYVSNRTHDTIAVFSCDPATGQLTLVQNAPAEGEIPRNFRIDPSGRWMIVAHQDSNSAAVFKIDADTGKLTFTGTKVKAGGAVCVRFLPVD
ncbi:MAG: pgl 1 [Verrucomicrobiales bacterium]|nr:pgl 1 [Verrucomicrobiales bacterium]